MLSDPLFYRSKESFKPLFRYWNQLSPLQQEHLMCQMQSIDLALLKRQQELLKPTLLTSQTFEAFTNFFYSGNASDQKEGAKAARDGQVGCLVLAGGQGSRLRFEGPKGLYPISPIKHKSLFQL